MKKLGALIPFIVTSGIACGTLPLKASHYSSAYIAKQLGWVSAPVTRKDLCGGYYTQPTSLNAFPHPKNFHHETTQLSAKGPTTYNEKTGVTSLSEHVLVTQPGRIIHARKAYLYRNPQSGKLGRVTLVGHVSLAEDNKKIIGTYASMNLQQHTITVHHGIYHFYSPRSLQPNQASNGWGQSSLIHHLKSGVLIMKHATYTTSSPVDPSWLLHASELRFNKKAGWGHAENAWIGFYHIPILYFPYYTFPIGKQRMSGFLNPKFGVSSTNGFILGTPYYFDLAPNYDDTVTPTLYSKRGILWKNQFRYLSTHAQGQLQLSFIYHDSAFKAFKNSAAATYPSTLKPYLNQLNRASANRYYLSTQDSIDWNAHWKSTLNLNYASDPYYFQSFQAMATSSTQLNQLLNTASLNYTGKHWNFSALTQIYQTLHPINQPTVSDQYRRLPEIDWDGHYPRFWHDLDFSLNTQFVNFDYESAFTAQQPVGTRIHLAPSLSLPLTWAAGFITPHITLDNTDYNTRNLQPNQAQQASRTLPIVNIDSGLYFQRQFTFDHHTYQQTLAPRLFYLNVPYRNQTNLPNYATTLLPFNYNQLFTTNAFTGVDRIQNANQLSLGLSSTIYNAVTAAETLNAGIGVIDYFKTPRVCLNSGCPIQSAHFSPIAGQVTYYPWTHWSSTFSSAWNPNSRRFNNTTLSATFDSDNNHILSLAYSYIDGVAGENNTNMITLSGTWPLSTHWQALAYWYYNVTGRYPLSSFAGVEYTTCGWAVRFIASRSYLSENYSDQKLAGQRFDTAYYVQLELKGLGSLGDNATGLVAELPGYNDPFSNRKTTG